MAEYNEDARMNRWAICAKGIFDETAGKSLFTVCPKWGGLHKEAEAAWR